jgi:hypothetical protein
MILYKRELLVKSFVWKFMIRLQMACSTPLMPGSVAGNEKELEVLQLEAAKSDYLATR